MMALTYTQRALLARREKIIVRVERQDGIVVCWDHGHERIYTVEDLVQMAEPGVVERFKNWFMEVAA